METKRYNPFLLAATGLLVVSSAITMVREREPAFLFWNIESNTSFYTLVRAFFHG